MSSANGTTAHPRVHPPVVVCCGDAVSLWKDPTGPFWLGRCDAPGCPRTWRIEATDYAAHGDAEYYEGPKKEDAAL